MKLVPLASHHLRLNEPLPFGVRDASGRLLLGAGHVLESRAELEDLQSSALFVDESETADWNRRVAAAMDQALRSGASLKEVAAARPDPAAKDQPAAPKPLSLVEAWQELVLHLESALRDARPGTDWRNRLQSVHTRARLLAQRRPDASLYWLVYESAHNSDHYSCTHALLTLLIAEQAAAMLGWDEGWVESLGKAALTMNVGMMRLQDQLANSALPPSAEVRRQIAEHPQVGARQLEAAGLVDPLCLQVVELHHDNSRAADALASLPPAFQLARLLRRVDIFGAKMSRRASRPPMSPLQAAREACLGQTGVPDEIGGALLKAVGLYPPGCFVELVSGEVGIVIKRGRRANLPVVASLVSASGNVMGEPLVRDTLDPKHQVKQALPPLQVKVRPQHDRLLALR